MHVSESKSPKPTFSIGETSINSLSSHFGCKQYWGQGFSDIRRKSWRAHPHPRRRGRSWHLTPALVISTVASASKQLTTKQNFNAAQDPKTGVPGAPSLHRAGLPTESSMRRRATPGTHGGDVGIRVMADAVGRRGRFPQGRPSPNVDSVAIEGNAPSGVAHLREPEGRGWRTGAGTVGRPDLALMLPLDKGGLRSVRHQTPFASHSR